jgi:hypothetical protein
MSCNDLPYDKPDVVVRGITRLLSQYAESPNLKDVLTIYLEELGEARDVILDVWCERWIDNADGVQLDVLGDIVGQPRAVVDDAIIYFGFDGDITAAGFGEGRWIRVNEALLPTKNLEDPEYRQYIKAKAKTNNSSATRQDIKDLIEVSTGLISYVGGSGAVADIILQNPTTADIALITSSWQDSIGQMRYFVTLPLGVGSNYLQFDGEAPFGFAGDLDSQGFGEGNWVNII